MWHLLAEKLLAFALVANSAITTVMAWTGTLLIVLFLGSGLVLLTLGDWFFNTSVLDDHPHEQKTTTEEPGYGG